VSIREHRGALIMDVDGRVYCNNFMRIREHTRAYVSIREHRGALREEAEGLVSIRQAYASIREHTRAYVSKGVL
jgi:hypothetical protein